MLVFVRAAVSQGAKLRRTHNIACFGLRIPPVVIVQTEGARASGQPAASY